MIIMVAGKSGSGKSTVIRQLREKNVHWGVVQSDLVRQEFLGELPQSYRYSQAANIATGAFSKGLVAKMLALVPTKVVLVESIGLDPRMRDEWNLFAGSLKQQFKLLYIRQPKSMEDWEARMACKERTGSEATMEIVRGKQLTRSDSPGLALYPVKEINAEETMDHMKISEVMAWIEERPSR